MTFDKYRLNKKFKGCFINKDLEYCDFSDMDLSKANFSNSNLYNANFTYSNLKYAIFTGADLSWANLDNSDVSFANFSGAKLERTYLSKVDISQVNGIFEIGRRPDGYMFYACNYKGIYIKAGCRWFSLEAAYAHWENKKYPKLNSKEETLIMLKLAEAGAKRRNW